MRRDSSPPLPPDHHSRRSPHPDQHRIQSNISIVTSVALPSLSLSLFHFPLPLSSSLIGASSLSLSRPSMPLPSAMMIPRSASPLALTDHGVALRAPKSLPTTFTFVSAAWYQDPPRPRSSPCVDLQDSAQGGDAQQLDATARNPQKKALRMPFPNLTPRRKAPVPSWPIQNRGQSWPPDQDGDRANGLGSVINGVTLEQESVQVQSAPPPARIEARPLAPPVPVSTGVANSVFFVVQQTMAGRGLPNLKLVVPDGRAVYCWREIIEAACPAFIDGKSCSVKSPPCHLD